jgi:phosphate transport system protein
MPGMTRHTDSQYEAELEHLSRRTSAMAARAESMVQQSVTALLTRDPALARQVVVADDLLDAEEVEVDRLCLQLLVRRAPFGSDLRFVTAVLKLVTDIERIGDLAVNIAERTLELLQVQGIGASRNVEELAAAAVDLLSRAMAAFRQRDAAAARSLYQRDREVDARNRASFNELLQFARSQPHALDQVMALSSICRHLERVGDHAVNIGERVVFMVEGEDLRHSHQGDRQPGT